MATNNPSFKKPRQQYYDENNNPFEIPMPVSGAKSLDDNQKDVFEYRCIRPGNSCGIQDMAFIGSSDPSSTKKYSYNCPMCGWNFSLSAEEIHAMFTVRKAGARRRVFEYNYADGPFIDYCDNFGGDDA